MTPASKQKAEGFNFSRPRSATSKLGRVYHDLTVIEFAGKARTGHSLWKCKCACGCEVVVRDCALTSGNTKSCGCRNLRNITKHGMHMSGTYKSWAAMKSRCDDPNATAFKDYGGRGITYCESWADFENFLRDMGERPAGMTIDRVDTNGNYEPGNCRWATRKTQMRNRRCNRMVVLDGARMTLMEAAERLGITFSAARYRMKKGRIQEASSEKA